MGGGGVPVETTECVDGGEEEEDWAAMTSCFSGVRLFDAPILLLVYFHKALRADLAELRRLAVEALERGSHVTDFILDLRCRFEFLCLFCKYHCAAEDEVIFLALDAHIKNIVWTYSLEHKSISDLFCSIFNCLDILLTANEDISSPFQELVLCIGTIQTSICQHMLKEEKQIFPLLLQHLTLKEQNKLVWQFICSVPLILLEDFFPWMNSFLCLNEQKDVMHCLLEVVPKEKLLQEVVISWTIGKEQLSFQAYHKYGNGTQFPNMLVNFKDVLKVESSKIHYGEEQKWKKVFTKHRSVKQNPIDGMHRLHGAIRRDLKEILEELTQLRGSSSFSTLSSVVVHLKFFANIFIFYSNALDKIFYPVLKEIADDCLSLSSGRFLDESQIEGLQSLLYTKVQSAASFDTFIEKLYLQLDLFVWEIDKHINFLETEVFTFISTNCSYEMQQLLLYTSLHMMPLGLLKCMVTWFSGHLSENESKTILYNIKQEMPTANESFASLLHEWVRTGYSGKTSIEKFRKDLQKMFDGRSSFLSQQIRMDSRLSYLQSDMKVYNRSNPLQLEQNLTTSAKNSMPGTAPSCSNTTAKPETLYSSGINLQVFFPQTSKKLFPLPKFSTENSTFSTFSDVESNPMDHIFFFHKALKKDLAYLVSIAAKLAENDVFLVHFKQRFHLLQYLYKIHSDSEDEFAFPALEKKGKLRNISHSYTIDHNLEIELFNRISLVLNEILTLYASVSSEEGDTLDPSKQRYHQLCVRLHDLCIAVHKILCDHIRHEEIELWPLFREFLSKEEQEKIVGHMLGRTRAEILQEMIPWLISYLTPKELHAMMSLWLNATKNTMFKEWLGEWWEGMKMYDTANAKEESNITPSRTLDPLEVVSTYLLKQCFDDQKIICRKGTETSEKDFDSYNIKAAETGSGDEKAQATNGDQDSHKYSDIARFSSEDNKGCDKIADVIHQTDKASQCINSSPNLGDQMHLLIMSQGELEATIRRVSRDSTLDPQKKSFIIQNLLMSRWVVSQKKSHPDVAKSFNSKEEIPGQHPSYRHPLESTFGCKHYKRNCKLLAACCNKFYTCIRCHDEMADHPIDRRTITKMMCMKCLIMQPVGPTCSTVSCNNLSMARYYCRICKLFDDERVIYHCPFCNLCRLGKGLGIDYFHCMTCNACMSRSLSVHTCRVKCFEDNCPICHEYIFTSSSPVKALPCGHLMHSACFQDYTCIQYTCPICSKSLGDMQVYFEMLDALLAEEKIPDEYFGKTQVILCNDCERRGTAAFHWLYHKCSYCGSYNTRLV